MPDKPVVRLGSHDFNTMDTGPKGFSPFSLQLLEQEILNNRKKLQMEAIAAKQVRKIPKFEIYNDESTVDVFSDILSSEPIRCQVQFEGNPHVESP